MKNLLLFISLAISTNLLFAQDYKQYFEGTNNSLTIKIDTNINNIWQIGQPQKILFNSAATVPNVIVTDTINTYPPNNNSKFSFEIFSYSGILAIQWMQKLDMEISKDGGIVEFSNDNGVTWENAINSPYAYNFYGYDTANVDTLSNGKLGFTGTDTTWKNIWLCLDGQFYYGDTLLVRFTFMSDSNNTSQEGWIIDNVIASETWLHTLEEARKKQEELVKVYPTITSGKVNIVLKKLVENHFVESMNVVDINGRIIQSFDKIPSRFFIDLRDNPNGIYYLQVNTNLTKEVFPITLQK